MARSIISFSKTQRPAPKRCRVFLCAPPFARRQCAGAAAARKTAAGELRLFRPSGSMRLRGRAVSPAAQYARLACLFRALRSIRQAGAAMFSLRCEHTPRFLASARSQKPQSSGAIRKNTPSASVLTRKIRCFCPIPISAEIASSIIRQTKIAQPRQKCQACGDRWSKTPPRCAHFGILSRCKPDFPQQNDSESDKRHAIFAVCRPMQSTGLFGRDF